MRPSTPLLASALLYASALSAQTLPDTASVAAPMRRAADFQIARLPESVWDNTWFQGTLTAGLLAAHRSLREDRFLSFARNWSAKAGWKIGTGSSRGFRNPDNSNCAQTYLEIYLQDPGARNDVMIADTRDKTDQIIATAKRGRDEWLIADHVFMAAPVLPRLYRATGDGKYLRHLDALYWDWHAWLFDPVDSLYFHDPTQAKQKSKNGKKVFWGRGEGWTVGALVRIIDLLPPAHATRADYIKVFQGQMNALRKLQDPVDGLWRTSLMDPAEFPQPEASCSAFFLLGMAWGVNRGILDRNVFLPSLLKGWKGLSAMVKPDGRLCCIQPEAVAPGATPDSTAAKVWYGTGIFLMAGEEMMRLANAGGTSVALREAAARVSGNGDAYDAMGRKSFSYPRFLLNESGQRLNGVDSHAAFIRPW
jgi:unsaturated rhamnogalacturonyl hydrolase